MLVRELSLLPYQFGEVLRLFVYENDTRKKKISPICDVRFPIGNGNIEHYLSYSVSAPKGVVPNQISKELFYIYQFFAEYPDCWREHMDKYADFCDLPF